MTGNDTPTQSFMQGRWIWVTGATSGIGYALTLALAKKGAKVIVSGRNTEVLGELQNTFPESVFPLPFDITDSDSIESAQEALSNITTQLDHAVLNAGNCVYLKPRELNSGKIDVEGIQQQMDVNFTGTIHCLAIALPFLLKSSNKPSLYCVSSLVTRLPLSRAEVYGASKAALDYFFSTLRIDIKEKVHIGLVQPGFVRTPLTDKNTFDMPFLLSAEDAAMRIIKGIERYHYTIVFPKRLSVLLTTLSCLPKKIWASLAQKMVRK